MKRVVYDGKEPSYNMLFSVQIVPGEQELPDAVAEVLVASGLVRYAAGPSGINMEPGIKVDPRTDPNWKRKKAWGEPDPPKKKE